MIGATRDAVRWLPTLDQVGVQQVTVRVIDPLGGSDEHSFGITVRGIGGPTGVTSVPSRQRQQIPLT